MRRKQPKPQKPDERFDVYLTVSGKDLFSRRFLSRRTAERRCDGINRIYRKYGHTAWIKVEKPDVNGVFPSVPGCQSRAPA